MPCPSPCSVLCLSALTQGARSPFGSPCTCSMGPCSSADGRVESHQHGSQHKVGLARFQTQHDPGARISGHLHDLCRGPSCLVHFCRSLQMYTSCLRHDLCRSPSGILRSCRSLQMYTSCLRHEHSRSPSGIVHSCRSLQMYTSCVSACVSACVLAFLAVLSTGLANHEGSALQHLACDTCA